MVGLTSAVALTWPVGHASFSLLMCPVVSL